MYYQPPYLFIAEMVKFLLGRPTKPPEGEGICVSPMEWAELNADYDWASLSNFNQAQIDFEADYYQSLELEYRRHPWEIGFKLVDERLRNLGMYDN